MILGRWYTNNVPSNPYNNIQPNTTMQLSDPVHFENNLVFSNKLITTVIPTDSSSINSYMINYNYLINIPDSASSYEALVSNFDLLNDLKGVFITQLTNLTNLPNLVEYFYQNNQLLNIIIPFHPSFISVVRSTLANYYVGSTPMFLINYLPSVDIQTLTNLSQNVTNSNPDAMIEFVTNSTSMLSDYSNNVLSSGAIPFNFYRADKRTFFYYEFGSIVPIVHVYVFSLNPSDPVLHAMYITYSEEDPVALNFINNYPIQSFNLGSSNNANVVFYSGENSYYDANVTISITPSLLSSFTPMYPTFDKSAYYVYYGRGIYNSYIQILDRVNSFTDYVLV